jgi:hypothetical protein
MRLEALVSEVLKVSRGGAACFKVSKFHAAEPLVSKF